MNTKSWLSDMRSVGLLREVIRLYLPEMKHNTRLRLFSEMCDQANNEQLAEFANLVEAERIARQTKTPD